jgi:hypothetical protein
MHNANYTKEMNSNEEIFQLEIKSKKFHQRGSFHLTTIYCLSLYIFCICNFIKWSTSSLYYTGFPVPFNECIYQLLNEY